MSRSNLADNLAYGLNLQAGLKGGSTRLAISADLTIDPDMHPILWIDPSAAKNVTFPTEGSRFIFIVIHGSTGNFDLTLKDSGGNTIATLSQNEMAIVVDDGVVTAAGVLKQT